MRTLIIPLAVLLLGAARAQERPAPDTTRDAVNWAVGLGGRFEKLNNPVVSSYALGQLAAHVCEHDRTAGAGLFRLALARLNTLPVNAFVDQGPILPVSSFTGLWRSIEPAAERCDPALDLVLDKQRTTARIAEERRSANDKLDLALQTILKPENHCFQPQQPPRTFSSRPTGANLYHCIDYPEQLADNAITTGDPDTLNLGEFVSVLVNIRELAPEQTDVLFAKSLGVTLSEPAPRLALLGTLGGYLFTTPASGELRRNTNPDSLSAYIDAVLQAANATGSPYYDAASAYRIMYPLLSTAREFEFDSAHRLEQALAKIQVSPSEAQRAQASLDGRPATESILQRDRLIDRVLSEARQKHFDSARNLLTGLDDAVTREQLAHLIRYVETLDTLEVKDFDQAFQLASGLRTGVKRALLYAGIMASAPREVALQVTSLATQDASELTAEHRAAVLSAASAALLHADPARALTLVSEVVKALNSVAVQPHRGVFDPRKERPAAVAGDAASTDVPQLLLRDSRIDEVVDSGRRWYVVELRVPEITAFSLPAVIRSAAALDPASLEAVLLDLRDEARLASALNALAELRLKVH